MSQRVSDERLAELEGGLSFMRPIDHTRIIGPAIAADLINAIRDLRDARAEIARLREALGQAVDAIRALQPGGGPND